MVEGITVGEAARKALVIIPAHNEEHTIGEVIHGARGCVDRVVVIDDASTDGTARAARAAGAIVLPLRLRLGAWGATQTGIRYGLRHRYPLVVSLDADGQHEPEYIENVLAPICGEGVDVVIGSCPERVSKMRHLAWRYFRLLTGFRVSDLTSGFRAYNHRAMGVLAAPRASLFDYQDIGVLMLLREEGLDTVEVPIRMSRRRLGHSRVFSSWWVVARYMARSTVLCLANLWIRGRGPRGLPTEPAK